MADIAVRRYYKIVLARGTSAAWDRWKSHLYVALLLAVVGAVLGFLAGPKTASVSTGIHAVIGIGVVALLTYLGELIATPPRLAREGDLAALISASERYEEWAIHLETIPEVVRAESPTAIPQVDMGRLSVAWYLQHGGFLKGSREHFKAAVKEHLADPSQRSIIEKPVTSSQVVADLFRAIATQANAREESAE
jgi:hypothetical protein